jgi:hypothetical protein
MLVGMALCAYLSQAGLWRAPSSAGHTAASRARRKALAPAGKGTVAQAPEAALAEVHSYTPMYLNVDQITGPSRHPGRKAGRHGNSQVSEKARVIR